jgi:ribonuclease Y
MNHTSEVWWWLPPTLQILGVLLGAALGYLVLTLLGKLRDARDEHTAKMALQEARAQADQIIKEAKIHAKDELLKLQQEFKEETKSHREEMRAMDERMARREGNLDRKVAMLDKKEEKLELEQERLAEQRRDLQAGKEELETLLQEQRNTLQRIAELSQEEARNTLMMQLEEEMKAEAGSLLRRIQEDTRKNAERDAREIITTAIQRYAADQVNEITTCSVHLPNDEMKGRIIGREGRNIRSLEAATGVDILIDDTPEVVVISGFDPLRREIARISLERLIADGRIHPARIEEVVSKVQEEIEETIRKTGEEAIYELGLQGVAPELVRTIGCLKFRNSYSQNVLQHSLEMGHLMGMMAAELDLCPAIAKRVGLFHDIGKALDHKIEGGHAIIGADLLRKHGEDPLVYNAVASHHGEVEAESPYASLAAAADAMTAARPGARSETTQIYLKRLEKLESIASAFRGVEKCYAIQAGREIRVLVEPSKIDDNEALQMARNIAKQVEEQLQYPGQIKVTVVRETRCVEYAH